VSGEEIAFLTLALMVLGAVVVAANIADHRRDPSLRRAVWVALLLINVLIVLVYGITPLGMAYLSPDDPDMPQKAEVWTGFALSLLTGGAASALLVEQVRRRLAVFFPRRTVSDEGNDSLVQVSHTPLQPDMTGTPLFPQLLNYYTEETPPSFAPVDAADGWPHAKEKRASGFNPVSTVHTVAMILCVYFLGVQMIGFALGGGMAGIAKVYESGLTAWELVANAVPFVLLAVLGVGLGVRRTWRQTLQRLGLVWPTGRAVLVTLAVVFGLFLYVALVTGLWMALVSEETYQEQTEASDALSESVTTIGLAFVLATTAAVGEEIAYRGALQPVFGLWPTAIVFALTHAQYTLTPAWLIILGVAVVFGWLRQQYGTAAAMLAHFVYNFVPLAFTIGISEEALLVLAHLAL